MIFNPNCSMVVRLLFWSGSRLGAGREHTLPIQYLPHMYEAELGYTKISNISS